MKRRLILGTAVSALMAAVAGIAGATTLPLEQEDRYVVGFPQMGSNSPWRIVQTELAEETTESRNWGLTATDAEGTAAKWVTDADPVIAQGTDLLVLPPREEMLLIPAMVKARAAGGTTFLVDRPVDPSVPQAGDHFVAFRGFDLIQQGERVAEWLIETFDDIAAVYVQQARKE